MNKSIKKIICMALCLSMTLTLAACSKSTAVDDTQTRKQLMAMDTVMTLTAYGKNGEAGIAAAQNIIETLDVELSPTTKDSLVSALNSANGAPTAVTPAILDMLATAKTVYDRTDGALDLSVYPLSVLWGFIATDGESNGYVPTQSEIDEQLKRLCFAEITVDGDEVTIPQNGEISFGSVAKGYTSDAVISALRQAGVESAIISLGGNIQTLGEKPDGSPWRVAVDDPSKSGSYAAYLEVGEVAVITSANNQRYFEKNGVRYHHIIDPATGAPAQSGLKSVTIVCESGTMADSLSTALFVLGADKAIEYWRTYGGFEMLLITEDNEIICTSGLESSVTAGEQDYPISFVE